MRISTGFFAWASFAESPEIQYQQGFYTNFTMFEIIELTLSCFLCTRKAQYICIIKHDIKGANKKEPSR